MDDGGEGSYWAARVSIERFLDEEYTVEVERLVVVKAPDAATAARDSGFPDAVFHEASADELDEWDDERLLELTPRELSMLDGLVRKRLLEIASRLRRGARPDHEPTERNKALQLNRLRGKLDALEQEAVEDQDAADAA